MSNIQMLHEIVDKGYSYAVIIIYGHVPIG